MNTDERSVARAAREAPEEDAVVRRATLLRARMSPKPRLLTPDEVATVEREGLFEVPAHRQAKK